MVYEGVCECQHEAGEHGRKRCMGLDSYGIRCECDTFTLDRDSLFDEPDDYPEDDMNDFIQPRNVARMEEVLHATVCTEFYADRARSDG